MPPKPAPGTAQVTSAELRSRFPELLEQLGQGTRVVVTHYRRPIGALVNLDDLQRLRRADVTEAQTGQGRPMQIIGTHNQSGGVGKTTCVAELGYDLSTRINPRTGQRNRILLVDTDPQASLTKRFGLHDDPASPAHLVTSTLFMSVMDLQLPMPTPLPSPTVPELHLIPSNQHLIRLDALLYSDDALLPHLGQVLRRYDTYDYILIDTPPSRGMITRAALIASDHVIIPVNSSLKAMENFDSVSEIIGQSQRHNPALRVAMFLLTHFQKNTLHDQDVQRILQTQYAGIAPTSSPLPHRKALFNDASLARLPVALYRPKDPVNADLRRITDELLAYIGEPVVA